MATSDGFRASLFLIYTTGNVCFEFTMQLFGMENCCKICQAVSFECLVPEIKVAKIFQLKCNNFHTRRKFTCNL